MSKINRQHKSVTEAVEPDTLTSTGYKFKLSASFYPEVIKSVLRFKGHPGFGIRVIKIAARQIFQKKYGHLLENGDWTPSDSWCYWFLHEQMQFRNRRITGKCRIDGPMTEKQKDLWDKLLDTLAKDFSDGVRPDMIIGSDEFGQFFFPANDYAWEEKGAKHVESSVWDDKRQYTGNLIHNANGELLTLQLIFGGKTSRSLPTAHVDIQKNWIMGFSPNHWSNIAEKKIFVDWVVSWRNKRLDELIRGRHIAGSRRNTEPLVLLLDCWSVNMSKDFRNWVKTEYPFIRLRYIPAGLTGKFQINDTYFHGPYKKWVRSEAENWYQNKFGNMMRRLDEGNLTTELLEDEVKKLMGLANLRNLSIEWNQTAMQKLIAVNEQGESLVSKGWWDKETYGQIFDEEFQEAAKERIRNRERVDEDTGVYYYLLITNRNN